MIRQYMRQCKAMLALLVILLACVPFVIAQDSLNLIQTAEYDIGFDCPVTSALDPAGTTLWVLMNNCGTGKHHLSAYSVADGTRVDTEDYTDVLSSLDGIYIDLFITPMGFTSDGNLSIRYNDADTSESQNLLIPLQSDGEASMQTSDSYNALLSEYSDYPEFSVYSPDHTRVVAADGTNFHVIDVQTENEIAAIPVEGSTDYALATFSANGEHLYITRFNNPDDMDDFSSTLLIYNIADGELLKQYPIPSSSVWVSPDETYAAVQLFSNEVSEKSELVVIDLESGLISPVSNLLEDPAPVLTCLNNGNDVSDAGYVTSGYLTLTSLYWLPDSSNIVLTLSYNGEANSSNCIFNYSRLRTYTVEQAN